MKIDCWKLPVLKLFTAILLLAMLGPLTGCAAAIRGSKQQLHVSTFDRDGNAVPCDCVLTNDEGTVRIRGNMTATVGRDKDPMEIKCDSKNFYGSATVPGKVNGGFWAIDFFVIDLCLISGWVDGLSGAWAEYPGMVDIQLTEKSASQTTVR